MSGQRINSAADDVAGSAIVGRLSTRVDGTSVAERNIGDGLSLLQTRSGIASSVTDQVQRMRELSVQAGPDAGQVTELADNDLPARLGEVGFSELTLFDATEDTLGALDQALSLFAGSQAADGASANRLLSQADNLSQSRIDASETRSRIADKDFAELASELSQTDVRDRARVLIQSQANAEREDVLRLLSG